MASYKNVDDHGRHQRRNYLVNEFSSLNIRGIKKIAEQRQRRSVLRKYKKTNVSLNEYILRLSLTGDFLSSPLNVNT